MFDRLIVPIDGSGPSKRALAHAFELARKFDSAITVITVASLNPEPAKVEDLPYDLDIQPSPLSKRAAFRAIRSAEEMHHIDILKEAEKVAEAEGMTVTTELLRGTPSGEIVKYLEDNEHDLVIMGSRGLGGFKMLLLGSTSAAVIHHCTNSILIVK